MLTEVRNRITLKNEFLKWVLSENILYTTLGYTNVIQKMQNTHTYISSQFVSYREIENAYEKKQAVCEGKNKKL